MRKVRAAPHFAIRLSSKCDYPAKSFETLFDGTPDTSRVGYQRRVCGGEEDHSKREGQSKFSLFLSYPPRTDFYLLSEVRYIIAAILISSATRPKWVIGATGASFRKRSTTRKKKRSAIWSVDDLISRRAVRCVASRSERMHVVALRSFAFSSPRNRTRNARAQFRDDAFCRAQRQTVKLGTRERPINASGLFVPDNSRFKPCEFQVSHDTFVIRRAG